MSNIDSNGPSIANEKVVSAVAQTDTLSGEGTTDKLFPDFIRQPEQQEEPANNVEPNQDENPDEQISTKVEQKETNEEIQQPQHETPSESNNQNSQYIDLDKMGDYIVVQNINGQKREIKLRDLNRLDQTDAAITQKAQRIAEERRQLEALRQELRQQPQRTEPQQRQEQQNISSRQSQQEIDRIAQLEQTIMSLQQSLSPMVYQNNRQRLANELKQDGFDDFLEYLPRIEQTVASVEDDNLFNYYNTPEGAKALYFQLKAKELKQSASKPQEPPKPPVPLRKPSPPVVRVGGGDQASNGVSDDWNVKYKQAMKIARENPGNVEAMNDVLRMKGILR